MSKTATTNNFQVYAEFVRPEMLAFIPGEAKSVLDVGCSVGNFGEMVKASRNAEVWGVEIDRDAARVAEEKLDKVFCSAFNKELDFGGRLFDCIVFNDVLEHMVDPYSALEYANQLLTPDGVVVASIPNVRHFGNIWALLVYKTWEYGDTGILDRTHLRFFTKKSIESTFTGLGYKIDYITGINSLEDLYPYLVWRFKFLNLFTLGHIEDMRWLQFAVVARPNQER